MRRTNFWDINDSFLSWRIRSFKRIMWQENLLKMRTYLKNWAISMTKMAHQAPNTFSMPVFCSARRQNVVFSIECLLNRSSIFNKLSSCTLSSHW